MKVWIALACVLGMLALFLVPAQAAENEEWQAAVDAFDLDTLEDATPKDVLSIVEDLDLSPESAEGADAFSLWDAVKARLTKAVADEMTPLKTLRLLIGLAAVAFFGRTLAVERGGWQERVTELLTLCACGVTLILPLGELTEGIAEAVRASVVYQRALIPVFAGLLTASGQASFSAFYAAFLLGYDQVVATVSNQVLVPVCRMLLSLCVCLPLSSTSTFSLAGIRKGIVSVLAAINGISTALLMAQSRISATVDRTAARAAKASLTALVPIVGTSLSESLSIILGSLDLVMTTVGVYSMITVILLFLSPLVRILLWKLALWGAGALFDAVGLQAEKKMLGSVSSLLTILMRVVLFCAVFLLVSTVIVMSAVSAI